MAFLRFSQVPPEAQEELKEALAGTKKQPEKYIFDDEGKKWIGPAKQPGALKAYGIGAVESVGPTLGALWGAARGGALGAKRGPIGAAAGTIGGALAGGGATTGVQELLLNFLPKGIERERDLARAAHPRATLGGQLTTGFLGGGPSRVMLKSLFNPKAAQAELTALVGPDVAKNLVKQYGLTTAVAPTASAALEAGGQMLEEGSVDPRKLDPVRLAMAGAGGLAQVKPWKYLEKALTPSGIKRLPGGAAVSSIDAPEVVEHSEVALRDALKAGVTDPDELFKLVKKLPQFVNVTRAHLDEPDFMAAVRQKYGEIPPLYTNEQLQNLHKGLMSGSEVLPEDEFTQAAKRGWEKRAIQSQGDLRELMTAGNDVEALNTKLAELHKRNLGTALKREELGRTLAEEKIAGEAAAKQQAAISKNLLAKQAQAATLQAQGPELLQEELGENIKGAIDQISTLSELQQHIEGIKGAFPDVKETAKKSFDDMQAVFNRQSALLAQKLGIESREGVDIMEQLQEWASKQRATPIPKREPLLTPKAKAGTGIPAAVGAAGVGAGIGGAASLIDRQLQETGGLEPTVAVNDLTGEHEEGPPLAAGVQIPPGVIKQFTKVAMKHFGEGLTWTVGEKGFGRPFRAVLDRLHDQVQSKGSALARDVFPDFRSGRLKLYNKAEEMFAPVYNLSKEEKSRVSDYIHEMEDMGTTAIKLSPNETKAKDAIKRTLDFFDVEKLINANPNLKGQASRLFPIMEPHILQTIISDFTPERYDLEKKFVQRLQRNQGMSQSEAKKIFDDWRNSLKPSIGREPRQTNVPEKYGLPKEFQKPLIDRLRGGSFAAANDLAEWRTFQDPKNPISARMSKILGISKDPNITWDDGSPVEHINHPDLDTAWRTDVDTFRANKPDVMHALSSLINAGRIGTPAAVRDLLSTMGAVWELVDPHEIDTVVKGLTKLSGNRIYDVGGIRRPAPAMARMKLKGGTGFQDRFQVDEAAGAIGRVAEAGRTMFGRNLSEAKSRQFLYETGRLITQNRMQQGNESYLKNLVGDNWRDYNVEELTDKGARNFAERFQGSYSASDLPKWLLRTGGPDELKMLEGIFQLARWPVSRYNGWTKNVLKPLREDGNIGPLLKSLFGHALSAGAIGSFNEMLKGTKPRELTWSEFLELDKPEAAYTIASKLQTAGYAGILSQVAMMGMQKASGEKLQGYNYPVFDFADSFVQRLGDAFQGMKDGAKFGDVLDRTVENMVVDNVQLLNSLRARERSKREPYEREEHIYKRMGASLTPPLKQRPNEPEIRLPRPVESVANVASPLHEFRKAIGEEEIEAATPELERAIVKGARPTIQSAKRPDSFYEFLERAQGQSTAEQARKIDQVRQKDVIMKRQIIRRLRSTAVNPTVE